MMVLSNATYKYMLRIDYKFQHNKNIKGVISSYVHYMMLSGQSIVGIILII